MYYKFNVCCTCLVCELVSDAVCQPPISARDCQNEFQNQSRKQI